MLDLYDTTYVQSQLEKFRNRHNNHWRNHIRLAKQLVSDYAPPPPASLLDLGCSIGTFALEFALDGYETIGLDFDVKALAEGKKLAREMGVTPKWICADAGCFALRDKVDTVICFDLLEHLSDDFIEKSFACVRQNLKPSGLFVFHTFPTEYDYIFYKGKLTCLPLIPFRSFSEERFEILVGFYARLLDMFYLLRYAKTHKRVIANTVHPNPLSRRRLQNFLEFTGFEILLLEASLVSVNPLKPGQGLLAKKFFREQPIAWRSLWGVARPK